MDTHARPRVASIGATSPIARELAMRFARDGAPIYLAARDEGEATRIARDIGIRAGSPAFAGLFEAEDYASHAETLDRATRELGGLDGIVVCFGTLGDETAARSDPSAAVAIINQNFTAAASILTLAAERFESRQSGFIIVFGSVAGDRARARNYVYGSAKGALALFTQGLRARLSRSPVHVMTVILGTVDTRMTWGRERTYLTVSPARAADAIYNAWRRKAEVVYVPVFWRFIMGGLKMLPERVFKRLRF